MFCSRYVPVSSRYFPVHPRFYATTRNIYTVPPRLLAGKDRSQAFDEIIISASPRGLDASHTSYKHAAAVCILSL